MFRPHRTIQQLVLLVGAECDLVMATKLVEDPGILRMRLEKGDGGLDRASDPLLGQLIAVANESFRREIGALGKDALDELEQRIRVILLATSRRRVLVS
jgi:hypothetical protein